MNGCKDVNIEVEQHLQECLHDILKYADRIFLWTLVRELHASSLNEVIHRDFNIGGLELERKTISYCLKIVYRQICDYMQQKYLVLDRKPSHYAVVWHLSDIQGDYKI